MADIRVEAAHDRQGLRIVYDNGIEDVTIEEAKKLIGYLEKVIVEVSERPRPPAPAPFMWEKEILAECLECTCQKKDHPLHCGGAVAGFEMYLENFVKLRDWLDMVIEYHEKNGCKRLATLTADPSP